jgi:hypothetical protein
MSFGQWVVAAIAALFLLSVARLLFVAPPARRRWAHYCGPLLILYGGAGFFFQGLAGTGTLPFVPASTEFPVLWPSANVRDTQGQTIIGMAAAGRVQVYDARGRFLRGWFVPNGGSDLTIVATTADRIEVFTGRGKRLLYDANGECLDESRAPSGALAVARRAEGPRGAPITSPFLLWPFAHPVIGFAVAALGMVVKAWSAPRGLFTRTAES